MIASTVLSACSQKPPQSMVKAQRRLAQYLPNESTSNTQTKHTGSVIDLSEGPKLKYQADFGPKNPDFDFKIESPY